MGLLERYDRRRGLQPVTNESLARSYLVKARGLGFEAVWGTAVALGVRRTVAVLLLREAQPATAARHGA